MDSDDLLWDENLLTQVFWDLCSPRERQVMYHIVQGKSIRELALHLGVSPNTVRQHLVVIRRKARANYALQEDR